MTGAAELAVEVAPRERTLATADTLAVGCIATVEKNGQYRRAEILGKKTMKSGVPYFYCNFDQFNKRLDEWVAVDRVDFSQPVEWPNPDKDAAGGKSKQPPSAKQGKKSVAQKRPLVGKKATKRPKGAASKRSKRPQSTANASHAIAAGYGGDDTLDGGDDDENTAPDPNCDAQTEDGSQRKRVRIEGVPDNLDEEDDDDEEESAEQVEKRVRGARTEELEKLRVSGSRTLNPIEVSRIRNLSKIQFGKFDLFPWYFSPYPEEFSEEEVVFICEYCLCYFGDLKCFSRHRQKCTLLHPPGNEIYRDDYVSFFEVDGRRQRTWCRNLCLLSRMFLDHKALYYDVDPFLFYAMTSRDPETGGCHLVGYFSKEKESADGYNLACILTLPQYQRMGYGRLLMQMSYELSKIEKKLGSPEKPLSDLGLLSYRQYWLENILELLIGCNERDERITLEAISEGLAMTPQDVEHTLQAMKMQVYHRGEHKLLIPEKLLEQRSRQLAKKSSSKRSLDPAKLQWKPPVFHAASRTWGW